MTLLLVALASGFQTSQIYALTHHPTQTAITPEGSHVSLAPSLTVQTKNESEGHHLDSIIIPAWVAHGQPHSLCPVSAYDSM